jgi:hypothetical protein
MYSVVRCVSSLGGVGVLVGLVEGLVVVFRVKHLNQIIHGLKVGGGLDVSS